MNRKSKSSINYQKHSDIPNNGIHAGLPNIQTCIDKAINENINKNFE